MDLNPSNEINFVAEDIKFKNETLALQPLAQPKQTQTDFRSLVLDEASNKRKMVDYSDVKFTDVYGQLGDKSWVAKGDTYRTVGGNQEEYWAKDQTTGEKWANGLKKFAGQVGTGVVGGTVGAVGGVYEWIRTGSFQASYDNDFMNYLDDLNKKWDYQLPNYYTESEKEAGFGDSLGSANFWAKDVLGGLAFTVSAIGSEAIWAWATGGASLSQTLARQAPRVTKLFGKADDILRWTNKSKEAVKAPIVTTGGKLFKNDELATALPTMLGKTGSLANTARFTYTSAGYEAGFEARHYMREMEDSFYRDFEEKNGRLPNLEEDKDFRDKVSQSANALYGFNVAVVGSSNLATVGRLFNIKSPVSAPTKWVNSKLFGVGVTNTAGELTKITATKGQRIAQNVWGFGRSPIIEGLWEEGMQSVGSNTAKNWVEASYNPEYTKNTYDLGQATIDAFAETYGTKEGWKEIGVGMIIGLISGTGVNLATGRGLAGEFKDKEREAANLENFSRYYSPKKMAESIAFANRMQESTKNAEEAEAKGDFTSSEMARKSAVVSQLNFGYNLDYFNESVRDTEIAIRNIDNESLIQEYGVDEKGAEQLKEQMVAEYQNTAKEYKRYRDFAEYFVSDNMKKEGLDANEASNVKQAIAYELTLGSEAYKFSSDIFETLKSKIAGGYLDAELTTAMDVDNTLLMASNEVKAEFDSKVKEFKDAQTKKEQLKKDNERLLKVILDETQEQKVARLQQLNNVQVEMAELEAVTTRLADEVNAIVAAANLKNPFKTESSAQYLSEAQIENLDKNLNEVASLANSFRNSDPQKALEIQKLRQEYARSMSAFKRYAELAEQLANPKLGLRGKRNIIAEIRSPKTANEITIETLQGLLDTRNQLRTENLTRIVESTAPVQEVLQSVQEEEVVSEEEVMEVTETEVIQEEQTQKESPLQAIQNIIKNNPYLLSYKGEGTVPQKPTEAEVAEYYDLATRALSNSNFDPETIGMDGQLQLFSTDNNLTNEELQRLQELNQKMADWQLYGGAVNQDGLSLQDIVEQQLLLEQEIQEEQEVDVTEDEFGAMTEFEPTVIENDNPRPENIGQVYSRVYVQARKDFNTIHNIGIQKFLDAIDIADKVVVTINGATKEISRGEVGEFSSPGHVFTVEFRDGSTTTISVEAGGVLKVAEFNKIKDNSQYKTDRYIAGKQSGYSLLYDGDTQVESDFSRIDEGMSYTDLELYNAETGTPLRFQVNMEDPFNKALLEKYKAKQITKEQFEASVKIYIVDESGNVLGDLKANRDIAGTSPEFLALRAEATQKALSKDASGAIELSKEVPLKYLYLGVPNFEFEGDGYKEYEINPNTIVDFGYTQGGKLVLNNGTKDVRTSLVSKVMKRDGVPVIVFKQGNYLVAFPVRLRKTSKNLGAQAQDILANADSPSKAVIELNKLLSNNGLAPKNYNLYYTDPNSQTLFDENGNYSEAVQKAIEDLNKKQDFNSPMNWNSVDDVVASSVINIDLENTPLVSPKPVLAFEDMIDIQRDVFQRYQNGEELTPSEVTEFAEKQIEDWIETAERKAEIALEIRESDEAISLAKQRIIEASNQKAELNFTQGYEQISEYEYKSTKGAVYIVPVEDSQFLDEDNKQVKFAVLDEKAFKKWKTAHNKMINDSAKTPTKAGLIKKAFTEKMREFLFENSDRHLTEIPKTKYNKKDSVIATNLETSIANNQDTIQRETKKIEQLEKDLLNVSSNLSERELTIMADKKVQNKAKQIVKNDKDLEAKININKRC
jgi:hypothetical protein